MKKLQCEICGGSLMMQDGIAVCESCGMKFSKDEVKKMVVELSGPIQIDGEVKVTGVDDADTLYRRVKDAERIGELGHAEKTYYDATKKYPGDARMWLGYAAVQVKRKLEDCEKELKGTKYYDDFELLHSFMDSEWCNQIEKLYERAQSLGGVADEAQQGLLCFRGQKELLIQKYKSKKRMAEIRHYWYCANAEFLNTFPSVYAKEEALAFLLKQDVKAFQKDVLGKINKDFSYIRDFTGAQDSKIWFHYAKHGSKIDWDGSIDLPDGMIIQGDIRPLLDGFTYKKGLLGGKKTYSYANDPDKDKGPVFDE